VVVAVREEAHMNPDSSSDYQQTGSQRRYYEVDGILRAYANRAMLLALIFGVIALGSLSFAFYVRLQLPTVIRIDPAGNAAVVGGRPADSSRGLTFLAENTNDAAPTEIEAKAVVHTFLEHYLEYTPDTVDRQFAAALNMMTGNFRLLAMNKLREDEIVSKIEDDHIVSDFKVRSIDSVKDTPLTYVAFGVNEVHRLRNHTETTERIVARYNVRLVREQRSERNPSGLLVAEFWQQQMVGERNVGLEQAGDLAREAANAQRTGNH
jgi:hypothetical protein